MYKRILVATDGSELSNNAVSHAISLAALTGGEVVALKVVPHYPQSYFEGSLPVAAEEVEETEARWSKEALAVVDSVRVQAAARGVKVEPVTQRSDLVGEAIINTAKDKGCDLIVMASHGRRGLRRLLLGSETQHVLTHSSTPVLVLR